MLGNVFINLTPVTTDAAVLIASLVGLSVTILAFRLGRAWIVKIATDGRLAEEYEEFKEKEMDYEYNDMVQDDLF